MKKTTKLIREPKVLEIVAMASSTVAREIEANTFPAPYKLTSRIKAWSLEEILDWVNSREKVNRGASNEV